MRGEPLDPDAFAHAMSDLREILGMKPNPFLNG